VLFVVGTEATGCPQEWLKTVLKISHSMERRNRLYECVGLRRNNYLEAKRQRAMVADSHTEPNQNQTITLMMTEFWLYIIITILTLTIYCWNLFRLIFKCETYKVPFQELKRCLWFWSLQKNHKNTNNELYFGLLTSAFSFVLYPILYYWGFEWIEQLARNVSETP